MQCSLPDQWSIAASFRCLTSHRDILSSASPSFQTTPCRGRAVDVCSDKQQSVRSIFASAVPLKLFTITACVDAFCKNSSGNPRWPQSRRPAHVTAENESVANLTSWQLGEGLSCYKHVRTNRHYVHWLIDRMPNLLAYAMLYIWPLVMIGLFRFLTPDRALIWSFLGAFMFLPAGVNINLPLIPTLDKYTIPSLTALVLCLTLVKQRIKFLPSSTLASVFMIGFVLSPFATLMTNREPFIDGVVFLPGLSVRDAISASLQYAITLIPFILGFNLLSSQESRRNFLTAYMIAGLVYSIPVLLEVRLAPQFSYWVYGYYTQLFGQQLRFDGFRPVVFMGHGLTVAFFMTMTVLSTALLWRGSNEKTRLFYGFATLYLLFVLIACKTVGAILFAAVFLPVIVFTGLRFKAWIITVCSLLVLIYPVLRSADVIPTTELVSYAGVIHEDRAQSLEFRFENENLLLEHAALKPVFGWGFWDRNRLWDPETGRGLTVTDGYWIIVIGVLGWTGYICVFGLLTLPLFRLWRLRSRMSADQHYLTYGTALLLAVNLLELLPNSLVNTMSWMLAGLLLASSLQTQKTPTKDPVPEADSTAEIVRQKHKRQPRGQRPDILARPERMQRNKRV